MARETPGRRRSVRLAEYDYSSSGSYFITVCTAGREAIFGKVEQGSVRLNRIGRIVQEEWCRTAKIRSSVSLDVSVVMPNHFHAIVNFGERMVGAHSCAPLPQSKDASSVPWPSALGCVSNKVPAHRRLCRPPRSLGSLVAGFKAATTRRANQILGTPGRPLWQRNYYEHVIRGPEDLARIRGYIIENPSRWEQDEENPRRRSDVRGKNPRPS